MSELPIRRILVEGAAIIVSILLAFSIDAWWEDRQQRQSDTAHLQGVLDELLAHRELLAEAIESHESTLKLGYELFELLTPDRAPEADEQITAIIDQLINFYRINAPFGSLQTAMSSGAIARMQDVNLASDIASWPTTIDDLLEEQTDAGAILVLPHYALLGSKISMRDIYARRFANPTGRGTLQIIDEVRLAAPPISHLEVNYDDIVDDIEVRNGFLLITMYGQAALGEATLANQKLDVLVSRLEQCLATESC